MDWKLADAKNKFSEVVSLALSKGPQRVLRRNDAVVILAQDDYEELTGKRPDFKQFLMKVGPDFERLDLARDRSRMRDVEL